MIVIENASHADLTAILALTELLCALDVSESHEVNKEVDDFICDFFCDRCDSHIDICECHVRQDWYDDDIER